MAARTLILILAAVFPAYAWAEVMDKEFGLPVVLAAGGIATLATFAASRWLPTALIVVVPITGFFFYAQLSELLDVRVGPAIRHEAGTVYVVVSWTLPVIVALALVVGLVLRRGKQNAAI